MVATQTRPRNPIVHYAWYGDLCGTAELVNGTGYLFRAEGEHKATLVSLADPALMLLGNIELATQQRAADGDDLLALVERRHTEQARSGHEEKTA